MAVKIRRNSHYRKRGAAAPKVGRPVKRSFWINIPWAIEGMSQRCARGFFRAHFSSCPGRAIFWFLPNFFKKEG
jgi:hypothetical protein